MDSKNESKSQTQKMLRWESKKEESKKEKIKQPSFGGAADEEHKTRTKETQ